ncbi:MAG: hypothetical protein DI616_01685 [Paracoccus denitrificans]|uniref:Uncharacterized protein n=1 Tax=Paracoccus denitrificans TaxID=266 RepID=A0A533IB63_PARDE|nr:MAG: hypothetical protein DI616_01685 [Paracoccus denitrificans]
MTDIRPRPNWMKPLQADPAAVDAAFQACVDVYRDHPAPTHLCRQCLSEEMEKQIIGAAHLAQQGKTPSPQDFAQIYFEHPDCVGGLDTIKLFLPHGIRTMLSGRPPNGFGSYSYPEVLEANLKAGFWFWPAKLIDPVRELAARLFWDWFRDGRYDWPRPEQGAEDMIGPGDEIMTLCIACLIDPADLIGALTTLKTTQSDEALSIAGSFAPENPFYISFETAREPAKYKPASDKIAVSLAAREAQAALSLVTPDWLRAAFWRHEAQQPKLAADLSEYEKYYDIKTAETRQRAGDPILTDWPDLPRV